MAAVMGDADVPPGGQDCTWEKDGLARELIINTAAARTAAVFMTVASFYFTGFALTSVLSVSSGTRPSKRFPLM